MATYTEHGLVKQEKFAPAVAGFAQDAAVGFVPLQGNLVAFDAIGQGLRRQDVLD